MLKRWNKSGQFYLIAAILISVVVLGFVVTYNYAKGETHTGVNDLKDEIFIESKKVISYGESQGYSENQFNTLFADFANNYVAQIGGEKSTYFLFGNFNGVTVTGYQEEAKEVLVISGTQTIPVTSSEGAFSTSFAPQGAKITLSLDGLEYDFLITGEQNFYFIISDIVGGSEYVARS